MLSTWYDSPPAQTRQHTGCIARHLQRTFRVLRTAHIQSESESTGGEATLQVSTLPVTRWCWQETTALAPMKRWQTSIEPHSMSHWRSTTQQHAMYGSVQCTLSAYRWRLSSHFHICTLPTERRSTRSCHWRPNSCPESCTIPKTLQMDLSSVCRPLPNLPR